MGPASDRRTTSKSARSFNATASSSATSSPRSEQVSRAVELLATPPRPERERQVLVVVDVPVAEEEHEMVGHAWRIAATSSSERVGRVDAGDLGADDRGYRPDVDRHKTLLLARP